ncbi:hypothetical protein GALMADRAFT_250235 [Galerina marginata CBS 339.88]|uniref:EKC/KEOPS complex subunit CGI121 n=1 Tax=Galerina marginata (strain CBS 339.88) TaxID=685588 RepID=A0A067T5S0_GALM3|nr:hypothetical protein GALMADRAFT_250235 [Galerina marginata CBS 339.88]
MESLLFPHFSEHSQVYIALFRNVSNAAALKSRIVAAATAEGEFGKKEREAVNFAFIDARLITSKIHLETAIYQAILAESQNGLRTRTVHSEVLYNLNPTHNITEAIRRYGVSETNTDVFVIRIDSPDLDASTVQEKMKEVISGNIVPISELADITDWASIKKYYKLNNEVAIKEAASNPSREREIVDNIVVSSVAMKSVMG